MIDNNPSEHIGISDVPPETGDASETPTIPTVVIPKGLEKYDYDSEIQAAMIKMAYNFNEQLSSESEERKKLIQYLKVLLPFFVFTPFAVVIVLIGKGVIVDDLEKLGSLLAAILAVPIGIIGVFNVISEKLFADTYRTSLPELMGKYREFTDPK